MRVAGKGMRRKVRFHVVRDGCWAWVTGCGQETRLGRWGKLSPAVALPTAIPSVPKHIRVFFFCLHSLLSGIIFYQRIRHPPTPLPLQKNGAQIVILNQKSGKKMCRRYSSCLTKHVCCKSETYARLAQQIVDFANLTTALWPKHSKEGLSLSTRDWCEMISYITSILWQPLTGMVLGWKLEQDGGWIEPCAFGPFRSSRSWLETCICSARCCASVHVCISWASLLNPVYSSAHVSYASLGMAVYSNDKYKVQRFNLFSFNTVWEGGVRCWGHIVVERLCSAPGNHYNHQNKSTIENYVR